MKFWDFMDICKKIQSRITLDTTLKLDIFFHSTFLLILSRKKNGKEFQYARLPYE